MKPNRWSSLAWYGAWLVTLIVVTTACKPRQSASEVKHVFGATRRDLDEPSTPCDASSYKSKFPVADAYLRKLTAHIAARNPNTLSGVFSADRLCVDLHDTDEFNARAMSRFMLVMINRPILEFAASDAEVASVLTHELAHVTMRHDSAVHPDLMKDAAGQKLVAEEASLAADGRALRAAREKLAAEERAHHQAERVRLSAAHPDFGKAVARMDQINAEGAKLVGRELSDFGPANTPYPMSQLTFIDTDGMDAAAKRRIDALRDEFSKASDLARDVAWKARPKEARDAESKFFDQTIELSKRESDNLRALTDQRAKVEKRTIELLGAEAAANWMEAEADEVGYELYLRAGFVGEGFTWINRVVAQIVELKNTDGGLMSADQVLEACMKARVDQKAPIARGAGDHPTSCWRLADIRLKEDEDHKADYAPLKAAASLENLPGSPTLAEAKKELESAAALISR